MGFGLTDEQKAAVFAPVGENLVSAAAGSGKTKVLSERIVERVKSGDTSIDRLLIVTFTRAAAKQMKERIAAALDEACRESGAKELKRQQALVSSADICTIDSFCIDIVKRNFFRIGIPSDFSIADSNAMGILREEACVETLEEMYEECDDNFILLAHSVGKGKNDSNLKEMILKVYDFTRAFANPDAWLEEAYSKHVEKSTENKFLFDVIAKEIEEQLKDFYEMLKKGRDEADKAGLYSHRDVFESECKRFETFLNKSVETISDGFDNFEFCDFKRTKLAPEQVADKDYVKSIHDEAKDFYKKIKDLYSVYQMKGGQSLGKIEALIKCVKRFGEKYMSEKLLRKELEFSDCEYLAYKALSESEEAVEELRKKYDEIYIDEYQDTNPLQDALFTLISRKAWGKPNLFIVGDVKQSIYRFRHSEPELFSEKSKTFGTYPDSKKMILSRNFRSRGEVLDSVNCVFEKIMRENTGGIEYNEEHALKCGKPFIEYNRNKTEVIIVPKKSSDEAEEIAELAREQRETMVAAKRIKELMDSSFMVTGEDGVMRKLEYADIAVLSPVIKGKADMITGIFNLFSIPVYCEASQAFFDTVEIGTMLSLLRCVDNPVNDIPLAALMRSPIFGFGENEMALVRKGGRNKPFYTNVCEYAQNCDETGEKCKKFVETLSRWRFDAGVLSVERFIARVMDESGYYSFVGALPGGSARQENLRTLLRLATGFESGQYKGLYNFVNYIDKTIETGGGVDVGTTGRGNSVLVTSIHKSKGLEFPVCIVIGAGKEFSNKDETGSLILNPRGGIALVETDAKKRVRYKTPEYRAVSMIITRESHAEQMRLLYVAMTRAKEKLILIGTPSSVKKPPVWEMYREGKAMSDYTVRNFTSYLDYVASTMEKDLWEWTFLEELPEIPDMNEDVEKEEEDEFKIVEEVIYRLSYLYPFDGERQVPSKMSVSEIKKLSMESEEAESLYKGAYSKRIPFFMKEDTKLTGNRRGTAFHRIMELIDLNETDVKGAIDSFVKNGLISRIEADSVECEKVEAFLNSPICERMRKAKRLWKEESFTIEIDARDVFQDAGNEKICVQGTIDCFFEEENGNIVLLDYKTDVYDEPEEVGAKYKKQLELYEVAIFTRFLKKCNEKCLYLFHKDDIIYL